MDEADELPEVFFQDIAMSRMEYLAQCGTHFEHLLKDEAALQTAKVLQTIQFSDTVSLPIVNVLGRAAADHIRKRQKKSYRATRALELFEEDNTGFLLSKCLAEEPRWQENELHFARNAQLMYELTYPWIRRASYTFWREQACELLQIQKLASDSALHIAYMASQRLSLRLGLAGYLLLAYEVHGILNKALHCQELDAGSAALLCKNSTGFSLVEDLAMKYACKGGEYRRSGIAYARQYKHLYRALEAALFGNGIFEGSRDQPTRFTIPPINVLLASAQRL